VDPVAWDLAERVAVRVAGREPFAGSYHHDSLAPDFAELTAQAEEIVAEETGLRSLAGPARARVTDRAGWVRANLNAFRRMLLPLTERLGARLDESSVSAKVTRSVSGVEVGTLLGWMSTRVLGQYDLLIVEEEGDRALAGDTRLLLLDEPFEGLAPSIVEELFESFHQLRGEVSIIIVDHHLDLVLALSDRTVALERGQVTHIGPSRALAADRELRKRVLWV